MAYDVFDVRVAKEKQGDGWTYVDVRSPGEFAQGHPEGAVNVPLLFLGVVGTKPNPDFLAVMQRHFPVGTRLLLGCRSGHRSARACEILAEAGYTALANVAGGILDWEAHGMPRTQAGKTWEDMQG